MSEIQNDIEQAREQLEACKAAVVQRDRVLRLTKNTDFDDMITKGFLKEECARFTHMSTDINASAEARADSLGYAQAAGYFKRWINFIITMGNTAENNIREIEGFLEEARSFSADESALVVDVSDEDEA